jgi:hypothetical protein
VFSHKKRLDRQKHIKNTIRIEGTVNDWAAATGPDIYLTASYGRWEHSHACSAGPGARAIVIRRGKRTPFEG